MDPQGDEFDVVIIGGGIAGIGAARCLMKESGLRWCLLEAAGKLGGRIQSRLIDGRRVDMGAYELASFLQARKQENSLYQLIKEDKYGLNYRQHLDKVYYYDQNGQEYSQQKIQKITQTLQKLSQKVVEWTETQPDLSVQACVTKFTQQGGLSHLDPPQRQLFDLFILLQEHEQAADGYDLAADTFFADGEMEEDCIDSYPLLEGCYDGLVRGLGDGLLGHCVRLGAKVESVEFKESYCETEFGSSKGKSKVRSKYVICAVPLPVIKNETIKFKPQIPESHAFIFQNLGFGYMEKIVLAFEEPFWPLDAQRIKIASAQMSKFPHFSNLSGPKQANPTQHAHILCCYITAEAALKYFKSHIDQQIIKETVQYLRKTFLTKKIKLKEGYVTRWMDRENIWGSFSYMRPKLRFQKAREIRKPVHGRLWFVGEYCYPENIGCAHGAYDTGFQAARSIINLGIYNKQ